jgi:hypothetical protein
MSSLGKCLKIRVFWLATYPRPGKSKNFGSKISKIETIQYANRPEMLICMNCPHQGIYCGLPKGKGPSFAPSSLKKQYGLHQKSLLDAARSY